MARPKTISEKEKKNMRKSLRPYRKTPRDIDWDLFEKLCELQCTQAEIAAILKVHPTTLSNQSVLEYGDTYEEIFKHFSAPGKMSLRRNQFLMSQTNAAMAIWLGKVWLGQRDNAQEETIDALKCLRDIILEKDSHRIREIDGQILAPEQPLLDTGPPGEEGSIQDELGAGGVI